MLNVVTPTYNRSKLIRRLYTSLKKQNDRNFIWYIIDDGSTDDTETVASEFINENEITIKYYKKNNGGKHTALNYAAKMFDVKDLIFIVDSDDYIIEDAIRTIHFYEEKYRNSEEICGFSFLRKHTDGSRLCKELPSDEFIESYIECRINRDITGDMAEVWFAKVLKEFPFPEYPGEKYVPEDCVWIPMARKYSIVFVNRAIYICDYLPGGLTDTWRVNKIKSPLSSAQRCYELTGKDCIIKYRIKAEVGRIVYSKFAGKRFYDIIADSKMKIFCKIAYIPSMFIYEYKKYKYSTKS